MKLTKLSVDNLKVAERIIIEKMDDLFAVRVERDGNAAYLNSRDSIMLYPSPYAAIRAIKRHTNVAPTTI